MKILFTIIIATINFQILFAQQNNNWFKYEIKNNSNIEKYICNYQDEYKKNLKCQFSSKLHADDIDKYAQIMANYKVNALKFNNVYYNVDEIETYIQKVLIKILPDTIKDKNKFKIYINRDPFFNAYAIHDGTFFINIGSLAYLNSESELAALLGHEIAHYFNNDSKENFAMRIKSETYINKTLLIPALIKKLNSFEYSRKQETEADSLGLLIISKAGYDPYAMVRLGRILLKIDKANQIEKKRKYTINKSVFSTHPHSIDRIENTLKIIKNSNLPEGLTSILDSNNFQKIKTIGIQEQINLFVEKNYLTEGLKACFKNHLLDPRNLNYIAISIGLIQKLNYLYPNINNEGFLTSHFEHFYFKYNESILKNLHYLIVDDTLLVNKINIESELTKNNEINTYSDAMKYFELKCNLNHSIEPALYLAMYYKTTDYSKHLKLLNKYINTNKSLYKDYAIALLNDNFKLEGNKNIYVCNEIFYSIKQFRGYYPQCNFLDNIKDSIKSVGNKYIQDKYEDGEFYYPAVDFENLANNYLEFEKLKNIYRCNFDPLTFKISSYSPEMWTYFKKNNIKNLTFIEIDHLKRKTRNYENYLLLTPWTMGISFTIKLIRLYSKTPNFKNQANVTYLSLYPSDKEINIAIQSFKSVGKFNDMYIKRIFRRVAFSIYNIRGMYKLAK